MLCLYQERCVHKVDISILCNVHNYTCRSVCVTSFSTQFNVAAVVCMCVCVCVYLYVYLLLNGLVYNHLYCVCVCVLLRLSV